MGESYLCARCGACPVPGSHICRLTPVRIGEPLQFDARGSLSIEPDPRRASSEPKGPPQPVASQSRSVRCEHAAARICIECYPGGADPRDARIAELEAALAGLVDALPRCESIKGNGERCGKRASCGTVSHDPTMCDEHDRGYGVRTAQWDSEAEAAERALGRRN